MQGSTPTLHSDPTPGCPTGPSSGRCGQASPLCWCLLPVPSASLQNRVLNWLVTMVAEKAGSLATTKSGNSCKHGHSCPIRQGLGQVEMTPGGVSRRRLEIRLKREKRTKQTKPPSNNNERGSVRPLPPTISQILPPSPNPANSVGHTADPRSTLLLQGEGRFSSEFQAATHFLKSPQLLRCDPNYKTRLGNKQGAKLGSADGN